EKNHRGWLIALSRRRPNAPATDLSIVTLWVAGLCWPPAEMQRMDLIAGLTAPVLQLGLLGLLAWRKLWRTGKSPLFCLSTVNSVVVIAVQLSAMNRPDHFYVLYWSTEIIYGLLALLAIGEACW